jgi:hypothetical protein
MPEFGEISWLGVLVAVVASQIIGFLWYGPLFGKPWMAALGKTQEEMSATGTGLPQAIIGGIIASIVSALALATILTMSDSPDVESGIKIGLLVSVGFVSMNAWSGGLFEGRNQTLTWINVAYSIVTYTVMGAILGAMW